MALYNQYLSIIEQKMALVLQRTGDIIPYTTHNNRFVDIYDSQPHWWTNGFWPGYLLDLYSINNNPLFLDRAEQAIKKLDPVLTESEQVDHDAGFMWYLSAGKHYQMTKNLESKKRVLSAAKFLASRFNIDGQFIVAWNGKDRQQWSIIDTLMNLPLLWFATMETGYQRYAKIALAHGNKALEHFLRSDGSVEHIVMFDTDTGEKVNTSGGQGFGIGSSWSRGQSWAIYGFTELYRFSGDVKFLDAAKRVAHYFLACVAQTDYFPLLDFRAPEYPVLYDSTAAAITASALIELSTFVPAYEKNLYYNGGVKLLDGLIKNAFEESMEVDFLLSKGSEAYGNSSFKANHHLSIIYGDYYFLEALLRITRIV